MSLTISPTQIVEQSQSPLLSAPHTWPRHPLGDVATVLNGFAFKSKQFIPNKGKPLIRIRDIFNEGTTVGFVGEYDERYLVRPGELLVGMDGDFNCTRWRGPEGLLNQRVCKVTPKPECLDLDFLTFILPGYLQAIHDATSATTVTHLSSRDIAQIPIPLPPLTEQKGVAHVISMATAKQKSSALHTGVVRRSITRLRQSVLTAAYSGRLTADWRTVTEENTDDFPSSWRSMHLSEVIESSFYGPRFSSDVYVSDGIPTIRTTDMDDRGNILFRDPPRLELNARELQRLKLRDGDLLVTRTGATIGKCAIYEDGLGPALPSAYLIRFRLRKEQALPHFILLFLLSPLGQAALRQASTATAQPNVNAKSIALIPVVLPPIDEQREIVQRASKLLSATGILLTRIDDASRAVERSSQAILAKAFRGELSPQEAAASA